MLAENSLNDLLNLAEIEEILSNSGQTGSKVKTYNVSVLGGAVVGFLGEHLHLNVDLENGTTHRFFLKTLPIFNQIKRKYIEKQGFFFKEATLYQEIFCDMPDVIENIRWRPQCYLTRQDLLVLQDISLESFTNAPPRFNFERSHVQLVLESLAVLHALSIKVEVERGINLGEKYSSTGLFEVSVSPDNIWFSVGLKTLEAVAINATKYSEIHKEKITSCFLKKLHAVFDLTKNIPSKFYSTICHRDVWNNNLMFQFETNEDGTPDYWRPRTCILIDFQISRYMPPGADVLMCLVMLQRRIVRCKDYQSNLKYYFTIFSQLLDAFNIDVNKYVSFELLVESCQYYRLLALILKGIFLTMTHLPEGEMDKIHNDAEEYHRFVTVDRNDYVLRYIREDKVFSDWMVETVEELIEITLFEEELNNN